MAYYAIQPFRLVEDPRVPTRNIVLTVHQAELIERLVGSGRYQNASEVLREGLRLVESREAEEQARIAALRDAARVGIADIQAGHFRIFETPDALEHHLASVVDEAVADRSAQANSE
ncbi:putative Transcriptional regulators (CopG/Arc/MetJ DNA-binding domain) [uncultured Defluviicoccus sp.]|mgnify:CR=1 FL=1|uniref:Putative Transcriptional regulators (CopG/Arc/MetJ DNA-binding domain) n=1 Tax=metagenome TaxID=256318 RepID=A0A380TKC5_9ZZZZ|nr:putative Transcriptional regulators (CopG/Arc/MetJ DNA-binding domain) [uncultured Defluviicoccus sp.]